MALSLQRYVSQPDFSRGLHRYLRERIKGEQERSMLTSISTRNGEHLPENVLFEILSWLPVKEVLQYKSVCKSWYAFISSPQFISKHLKNNRKYNENCFLAQFYMTYDELELFELLVDEAPQVLAYKALDKSPMYGEVLIYGPCDGLYYLCDDYFYVRSLWNPAINELRTLPPLITKPDPPTNTTYALDEFYGFGLDPITEDYKVVVIKGYCSTNDEDVSYPMSVLVYSLRTNSWKYCGDLARTYDFEKNKCYLFVKGCCFWLELSSHDDANEVIISFDMASDSFQEIPVPNYQRPAFNSLGKFDDSLTFFSVHRDINNLDIWTMNEGKWTKKFSIELPSDFIHLVGHWKDNKVLLGCEGYKLVLCDPSTKEIKDLGFNKISYCERICTYMETLVSIKNKNKPKEDEPKEDEEVEANISPSS